MSSLELARGAVLLSTLALFGCPTPPAPDGGVEDAGEPDAGEDAGTDGGNVDHGAPSTTWPAFTIDWPQLLGSDAGILADPRLVAVTFDGDVHRAALESFVTNLGTSAWWQQTTAEYGVGPATVGTPVHLAGPAPTFIDDSDVQTFLTQQLDGTHPEWPAPDGRNVYLLYYPDTTRIQSGTFFSCTNFGGYHSLVKVGGKSAPYAVLPRCPANPNVPAVSTELGLLTGVTSHEVNEIATDVDPYFRPGYRLPADKHIAFVTFAGAETGDMCEFNAAAWVVDPQLGATVQRTWSNAAAKQAKEPCVPARAGPYFTAVPVLTEDVQINVYGASLVTRGVHLAVGESKTVQLLLVSDSDTGGPFTLSAKDRREFFGLGRALSFRFDRNQGVNGEKVYLTITRTGNDPDFCGAIPFAIISSQGSAQTYWFSVAGGN